MSSGRILAAGFVGGLVMFFWGAAAHMVLQLDRMAIRGLPGEELIMPALRYSLSERGVYVFPGWPESKLSKEEEAALVEKHRVGPRGMLIYNPEGGEMMTTSQLGTEFLSNVLAALFVAILLSRVGSVALRAIYSTMIGLVAWLSIDVSYWNWYGFTGGFAAASFIEQTVGWFLVGLAIALVLGRKKMEKAEA